MTWRSICERWTPQVDRKVKDTLKSVLIIFAVDGTFIVTPALLILTCFTDLVPGTLADFWVHQFAPWWWVSLLAYWTGLSLVSMICLQRFVPRPWEWRNCGSMSHLRIFVLTTKEGLVGNSEIGWRSKRLRQNDVPGGLDVGLSRSDSSAPRRSFE